MRQKVNENRIIQLEDELVFVIPVYNDWESVQKLSVEIDKILDGRYPFSCVLVNDSSDIDPDLNFFSTLSHKTTLVELSCNLGHQKAIAIGLAYVNKNHPGNYIIVMDSDGEDRPEDILRLLKRAQTFKGIIFANRSKRSEGPLFRLFYRFYKLLFTLLTGKKISFGNFCLIQKKYLGKIVHVSDIWNHFSGGIIRSGLPYTTEATQRGKRYFGVSKMNFTRLILHGFSSVSVYADFMAMRLILLSFFLIAITFTGIIVVALIRFLTDLAVPGWATFTVLGLGIVLFLALFLAFFLLFNILSLKTQKAVIPARDYADYIVELNHIEPHE